MWKRITHTQTHTHAHIHTQTVRMISAGTQLEREREMRYGERDLKGKRDTPSDKTDRRANGVSNVIRSSWRDQDLGPRSFVFCHGSWVLGPSPFILCPGRAVVCPLFWVLSTLSPDLVFESFVVWSGT